VTEPEQNPWGDMPHWSDDQQASGVAPAADPGVAEVEAGPETCSWCATPAHEGETRCASCGAALAQRETIGDLVIPGLTAVDPALKDLDGRPLHLTGPSPSHGLASGVFVAAVAGGPLGLAIIGGVGAVAAAEYLGAGRDKPGEKGHDNVGEASGAVVQAIERLERGENLPTASETTPRPELDTEPAPSGAQSPDSKAAAEEASDGAS
jgi:hypothetical protein